MDPFTKQTHTHFALKFWDELVFVLFFFMFFLWETVLFIIYRPIKKQFTAESTKDIKQNEII